MNWGHKLTIVFVAFAALIGTLVYKCTQHKFDLVSSDYYSQELRYQEKIDGSKAAAAISPLIINQTASDVVIQLPAEVRGLPLTGEVWLYCANKASADVKLPLQADAEGRMMIGKQLITASNYTAKITWSTGSNNYYKELPLTISQ